MAKRFRRVFGPPPKTDHPASHSSDSDGGQSTPEPRSGKRILALRSSDRPITDQRSGGQSTPNRNSIARRITGGHYIPAAFFGQGVHPTSAHSSRGTPSLHSSGQGTPDPRFSDQPIDNGIYTITNECYRRFVYLQNPNVTTPLRGHFNPGYRNAQWHIRSCGNGEYSIRSVEHNRYAYCGELAGVKACVQGFSMVQLWRIQARPTGGYTIATTDTGNLWMLPYDGPDASVELFNISTDRRCWWTLEKREIEAPANEKLIAQPVVFKQKGLVAVAEIPAIPSDMDLDVPESEPHLAECFVVSHAMPGDMDLDVDESEPYLAQRFQVHIPNLSGQVRRLDQGVMFPGTHSTVYPGMYGDQKVAIKELRMVKKSDNIQRKFRRELFIWWNLRHVNVLPLYGYFEDEEGGHFPSLISKWAGHGSAAQYINRDLKWDQRASLFYDVAKGLNYLHGFQPIIVHADLKPQNVVVDNNGVGQLCDFGITRFVQEELESGLTTTTAHTGTTRYLAYELVEYEDEAVPTAATDMYALGCLGLEFIYQIPPHASLGIKLGKIARAIENGIPPAKRPTNPEEVVPILWDLVEACWITAPEERPTATQVCDYLEKNLEALSESLERCSWDQNILIID